MLRLPKIIDMSLMNRTDWSLLAKYMAGETSEKETREVKAWAEKNADNRTLFNEIKSDWNKMDQTEPHFNADKAWNNVHSRINAENSKKTGFIGSSDFPERSDPPKRRDLLRVSFRIAASLLLLAILGFALVTSYNRLSKVSVTASLSNKGKSVELPDGSVVYLNTNAQLSYPRKFGSRLREVHLNGEAFFEVSPDKHKPFIIYAGDARIKVVGTSFNVNSNTANQVEVYVTTGIVELSGKDNPDNSVLIRPGNIGTFGRKTVNLMKAENANSVAWKTRILTFNDTPLNEAVSLLKDVYDVKIIMNGKGMDTIKVNGDYNGDPLDIILKAISANNNLFAVAKSEDTIYLSQ
jgi:ferric-dicitrate binding protein FerR (iron transport regulator)